MIKLISNEMKKINKSKIFFSDLLIILIVYLIVYFNRDKDSSKIYETIYTFFPFLSVWVCILFGGIVSNEFQNGTIRVYLTKPFKRWKIVLSKLLIIYLYIIHIFIITILSYDLIINIHTNFLLTNKILLECIYNVIPIVFSGTICLFLSILTNNTAITVGLSMIVCLTSTLISQILFNFGYNFIEYTFLPYMDFSTLRSTEYINILKINGINLSIRNGIYILLFNIVLFIILSLNIFTKKDIKN